MPDDAAVSQAIQAAEKALLEALVDRDHAAVAAMLDDDFVITTAGWMPDPVGKTAWLNGLAQHHLDSFTLEIVGVRTRGLMTVVLVKSHQEGRRAGETWRHDFCYTDVWVNSDDKPLLLVRHASAARPPEGAS